jgi:hypothetical protein
MSSNPAAQTFWETIADFSVGQFTEIMRIGLGPGSSQTLDNTIAERCE